MVLWSAMLYLQAFRFTNGFTVEMDPQALKHTPKEAQDIYYNGQYRPHQARVDNQQLYACVEI